MHIGHQIIAYSPKRIFSRLDQALFHLSKTADGKEKRLSMMTRALSSIETTRRKSRKTQILDARRGQKFSILSVFFDRITQRTSVRTESMARLRTSLSKHTRSGPQDMFLCLAISRFMRLRRLCAPCSQLPSLLHPCGP